MMLKSLQLPEAQSERLLRAVKLFPECRILIVGDLMLDTFVWGEVRRISPEAPVPVVEVSEESQMLGGSANVAHNVASLGGQVIVAGVVGKDSAGRRIESLFRDLRVPTDGLLVENGRPTTTKTRVIARQQQVVRFDREWKRPLNKESTNRLMAFVKEQLPRVDAVIVSDYAKGVVSREFLDGLRTLLSGSSLPVIVDPKVQHLDYYHSFTMVTPNHHEAARMSGIEIHDAQSLMEAGRYLLDQLRCRTVLITRGKDGMSLFHQDGAVTHIPTVARRVFDVTGAGDTVIATIGLGIAAGLSADDAAILANLAAGVVVGEVGTAVITREELLRLVGNR